MRDQGYTVFEAANGDEVMRLARELAHKKIHLVLTDLVMPQMGGKELVEQFELLHPDTRILFISGYTDGIMIHQASLKPGTPFLQKPFSPITLARKVREILDG